jgi:hypothetical protein
MGPCLVCGLLLYYICYTYYCMRSWCLVVGEKSADRDRGIYRVAIESPAIILSLFLRADDREREKLMYPASAASR